MRRGLLLIRVRIHQCPDSSSANKVDFGDLYPTVTDQGGACFLKAPLFGNACSLNRMHVRINPGESQLGAYQCTNAQIFFVGCAYDV